MARVHETYEHTGYDAATGEVLKEDKDRVISWGEEPDYVKLYLQDVLYLSDMPTQYSAALMSLLKRTSYAGDEYGMCVVLVPMVKDAICKELGYKKRQSLDNVLQKLVKGEILFRVGRGIYRLNPYLFGRGTWAKVSKIRMTVQYTPGTGRTFQTVIEEKARQEAEARKAHREPQEAQLPGQMAMDTPEAGEAVEAAQEARSA